MVCQSDYELRNPQDFLRIRPEHVAPPWVRPQPVDVFATVFGIRDVVEIESGEGSDENRQTYIDPTYFAQDYIAPLFLITTNYNRSFSDLVVSTDVATLSPNKSLTDTATITDSLVTSFVTNRTFTETVVTSDVGNGFLGDYIDSSYFVSNYVGTSFSF